MKISYQLVLSTLFPMVIATLAVFLIGIKRTTEMLHEETQKQATSATDMAEKMTLGTLKIANGVDATKRPGIIDNLIAELKSTKFGYLKKYGFFILDNRGKYLLNTEHPKLEGEFDLDAKDAKGHFYVKEIMSAASAKDSSKRFYKYTPLGEHGTEEDWEAYATTIKGVDWTIGTSYSLTEIKARADEIYVKTKLISYVFMSSTIVIVLLIIYFSLNLPIRKFTLLLEELTDKATHGDLSQRGETTKAIDDFRPMIRGFNNVLDAVNAPIIESMDVISKLAAKNLSHRVNGNFSGRFADFKANINAAIEHLDEAIQVVQKNSLEIAGEAHTVTEIATTLSHSAASQSATLEQISSSVMVMSTQINQDTEEAGNAARLAKQSQEYAENGIKKMNELNIAMDGISEASNSISKILKAIDDIAFQTNLLALNAVVEAARAGSHGKAFAVVADEVRNLAARSATAAKETSALIEATTSRINVGKHTTDEATGIFDNITTAVKQLADLSNKIASASTEHSEGIRQISGSLSSLGGVVQGTTASAEESAGAAEQLAQHVRELNKLTAAFER